MVSEGCYAEFLEKGNCALSRGSHVHLLDFSGQQYVVDDAAPVEQEVTLKNDTKILDGPADECFADMDGTGCYAVQARDQAHQGALAAPAWANNCDRLTLLQR